jgi:hypothetical protein
MGFINLPPNVRDYFEDLQNRVRKLETAQRFTAPNVTTDPTNPRKGDIWLNTTTNTLKIVDANGTIRTITLV